MKTYLDLVAAAKQRIRQVSLSDADKEIAQADALIDVREESEYAAGHLPGAIHMSRGVVEAKLTMTPQLFKPETRIVLYCRTDARASMVATSLLDMGFGNVKVIAGGFDAWVAAGKPLQA